MSEVELAEHCPYLPGRDARLEGFFAPSMEARSYRALMDKGYRRSGRFFYRPRCMGCNECISLRVIVDEFSPTRSQRRCRQRNADLQVEVGTPALDEEKYALYRRYLRLKHGEERENDVGAVWDFLYNPVVPSLEFSYRDRSGRLLAVGICDLFADGLSSVYSYYDPEPRGRGLGTYTALCELDHAAREGMAYYFMGYYISECSAMRYKASYRPHQLLKLTERQRWVAPGEKAEVP